MEKLTCLDLFCGAGGLTEGFLETGKFNFLAHVEWEKPMVDTLRYNLRNRWGYSEQHVNESVIQFDVQKTEELFHGKWNDEIKSVYGRNNSEKVITEGLDGIVGNQKVDVIIGGPPCQAYSIAGRAQDPNSMKDDYRNYLFESFVKIVDHYKPNVFVFENVPGILSACPGGIPVIERIYEAFDEIGYEIRTPKDLHHSIYCSSDFAVPQKRKRVIIIGVPKNAKTNIEDYYEMLDREKHKSGEKTVRDAIGDLPKFRVLSESKKTGKVNISHELIGDRTVSLHNARYHNVRDIKVFRDWVNHNMNDLPNNKKLEYYKKVTGKTTNHNKYRSLEWDKPSPTIVSHLQKDGLMFIHPDAEQARSITMREAALLQSFPIDYEFIGSSAYCFKMIGNAVPVLFAKAIAEAVARVQEEKK